MEFKDLKNKSEAELHRLLAEMREKLRELRFKDANRQLKDVREIRQIRKTIARILTLLNSLHRANKHKQEK
ncbi:50S ribosomal protein L29 [Candidatus Parcubacteria bacterium]|nr:MAG: 50S ribosomal protein L29 [Candidatus Parcubacteria bacterium]